MLVTFVNDAIAFRTSTKPPGPRLEVICSGYGRSWVAATDVPGTCNACLMDTACPAICSVHDMLQ